MPTHATVSPLLPGRLLRLREVLTYVPVSKATWHRKVKSKEYPQAISLGPMTKAYRSEDIIRLIEQGVV